MKTSMDMLYVGFNRLNVPEITSVIKGDLYMLERPKNSLREDIVVNALPITNSQLQTGVFNVNIHVPNLKVKIGGKLDETQPDLKRMRLILQEVLKRLTDYIGDDFRINAQQPGLPVKDQDNTWYINIRVNYYAFQADYLNI